MNTSATASEDVSEMTIKGIVQWPAGHDITIKVIHPNWDHERYVLVSTSSFSAIRYSEDWGAAGPSIEVMSMIRTELAARWNIRPKESHVDPV